MYMDLQAQTKMLPHVLLHHFCVSRLFGTADSMLMRAHKVMMLAALLGDMLLACSKLVTCTMNSSDLFNKLPWMWSQ